MQANFFGSGLVSADRLLSATVEALRDSDLNCRCHMGRIEEHLLVVESEHGEATERESRIRSDVPTPVGRGAVMGEAVDLDDESLPN